MVHEKPLWNTMSEDLEAVPWQSVVRRFSACILPIITILCLAIFLAIMPLPGFAGTDFGSVCNPDGTSALPFADSTPCKEDAGFVIDTGMAATPCA